MKLNREQFLAAALALSATAGGCKLGAKSDDVAAQASPESPQQAQPGTPAAAAPAVEGAGSGIADPEANKARDQAGASERGTATGSGIQSKGLVKAPAAEGTAPTKEIASPTKEVVSPTKEVVSPTKEVVSPTKEKLPAPTSEYAKKPPAPTKEL
ncbi:MAG: hypothetical protein HS104_03765 [Polyangiaceae bacterium]|nr:hypothetical protein [Polyangiaceae bacterium]MCE7891537.1 hypothetical protein [Sorangiineae bacterium PRO1]